MKRIITIILSICLISIGFSFCKNIVKEKEADNFANDENASEETTQILHSVPSALETAFLLKNSGITFDEDALNPLSNTKKYITTEQKAINLGVYSTDLCFSCLFNQSQTQLNYFRAINNLSQEISINLEFDNKTFAEIEKNSNNIKYLQNVISNKILKKIADKKQTDEKIGVFIVFGVCLEGLYLLINQNKEKKCSDPLLIKSIYEQQPTIANIMQMVKEMEHPEHKFVLQDMEKLNNLLKSGQIERSIVNTETNIETKTTKIKTKSSYNTVNINELEKTVFDIRTKYTN